MFFSRGGGLFFLLFPKRDPDHYRKKGHMPHQKAGSFLLRFLGRPSGKIGPYDIGRALGRGALGAWNLRVGRKFAQKKSIRFTYFQKQFFGFLLVLVFVGVVLEGEAPVGLPDFLYGGGPGYSKNLAVIFPIVHLSVSVPLWGALSLSWGGFFKRLRGLRWRVSRWAALENKANKELGYFLFPRRGICIFWGAEGKKYPVQAL